MEPSVSAIVMISILFAAMLAAWGADREMEEMLKGFDEEREDDL